MNQIYRFQLSIVENGNTVGKTAFPIYANGMSADYEKESNEEFFRKKINGKFTFVRDDYDWIIMRDFDTEYTLIVLISSDAGITWTEYWRGVFYKTDCEIDESNKSITVTPAANDKYKAVLDGLEKEFDLISLAPQIVPVNFSKRPVIQVYVPGQNVIGCFLSGMYWEQECESEDDTAKLTQTGDGKPNFQLCKTARVVDVTQQATPAIPDVYFGDAWNTAVGTDTGTIDFTNGAYKFERYYMSQSGGSAEQFRIVRVSDSQVMWMTGFTNVPPKTYPLELTLTPVSGSGAVGDVKIFIHDLQVYTRYLCDVDMFGTTPTYKIGDDDIVPDNRNYSRVVGYNFPTTIIFSSGLSETPTQWGLYQPGQYYQQPYVLGGGETFPVSRSAWGRVSIWFMFYAFDWIIEAKGRKAYTLNDAYPLSSVISVLLGQIAPGITHDGTSDYSEFLYGQYNPISGVQQTLFITPKSNIIFSGYDQPAQKAPITLKQVLEMLKKCFRCYWFIDDQNRFRIEHIQYFRRGGTYSDAPVVGTDLTLELNTRNGKPWAFGKNQYTFEKPDMPERYQFGWMDDVTKPFNGFPIDIVSKYVNLGQIEEISVGQFTSDIDYILLNPNEISKDGFVLLAAYLDGNDYKLPIINVPYNGSDHYLQNAYVAFILLQDYYAYDMPASHYEINDAAYIAQGIKRTKIQTIMFPIIDDPDVMQLIKTGLGNGAIKKLSINLSSRNANATLSYEPE